MSKKCARCEKTVYPIEELKCLDKVRFEALSPFRLMSELGANQHTFIVIVQIPFYGLVDIMQ
jgi:hypothetical protein